MPKAPKAETVSHQAAVRYLRTILPTYAPGTAESQTGKFRDDHWASISEALDALDSQSQPTEGGNEALNDSTPGSAEAVPEPKMAHCVRCHDEFDTEDGGYCEIPHVFSDDPRFCGEYDGYHKIYDYYSSCCKNAVVQDKGGEGDFLDLEDGALEACIELEHTTDTREVYYNGKNAVKCKIGKEGKCMMECLNLEDALDEPLFACNVHRARYSE